MPKRTEKCDLDKKVVQQVVQLPEQTHLHMKRATTMK